MNGSKRICLVKASPKFAMWKISSSKCIKSAIKLKNRKILLILPWSGCSKLALQYYLPMLSLVIRIFYTSASKSIHKSILLIINYIPSESHIGFDPVENNSQSPQLQASKAYSGCSYNFIFHSYSWSIFFSTTQNLFSATEKCYSWMKIVIIFLLLILFQLGWERRRNRSRLSSPLKTLCSEASHFIFLFVLIWFYF